MLKDSQAFFSGLLAAERDLASCLVKKVLVGGGIGFLRDAQHSVLAGGGRGRSDCALQVAWVAAGGHRADAVAHDLAGHDHAAIRGSEMLEGVYGYCVLARQRVDVGGMLLALLVGSVV